MSYRQSRLMKCLFATLKETLRKNSATDLLLGRMLRGGAGAAFTLFSVPQPRPAWRREFQKSPRLAKLEVVTLTENLLDWLRNPEALLWYLLDEYGVWMLAMVALIVFIESGVLFPVLPGDSMLFALGLLHLDMGLNLWFAAAVLVAAGILGAQVGYWFGLLFGDRFFKPDARVLKTEYLDAAHAFFEKWGGPAVVLGRFVPFVRTFVPIAAGMGHYRWVRFTVWNVIGSASWVALFLVLGALLGKVDFIRNNVSMIAIFIVLISVLPIVIGALRSRLQKLPDETEVSVEE